jgi:molybdenum-dependent DNA-binding transcriptional regulator ModE
MTKANKTLKRTGRPGHIAWAARELGVNHSHLWRVVRAGRPSARLMGRYASWMRAHGFVVWQE